MSASKGKTRISPKVWLFGAMVALAAVLYDAWVLMSGQRTANRPIQIAWLPVYVILGVTWLVNYRRSRR